MLQYRTDYVNKIPILGPDGTKQSTLMLIDVAYLGKNDNDSLVFLDGDKHGIWPSMLQLCVLFVIINYYGNYVHACINWQVMSHMMAHLGQRLQQLLFQ